jgi:hypothetical protein
MKVSMCLYHDGMRGIWKMAEVLKVSFKPSISLAVMVLVFLYAEILWWFTGLLRSLANSFWTPYGIRA